MSGNRSGQGGRRRVRARAARLAAMGGLLAAVLGACVDDSTGPAPANLAPRTYLSVESGTEGAPLDTVLYRQVLHWWGTDPDGEVAGYLLRWDGPCWTPPEGAERWPADPDWIVTTATSDTFILSTYGTYAECAFHVRALDDRGLADPVGRRQEFRLQNRRPQIAWSRSLARPDTSYPAAAFAWRGSDLDGAATIAEYRYWLTREAPPAEGPVFVTTDTLLAIGGGAFELGGDRAGTWTLHGIAVDESGAVSDTITHQWIVVEPEGEFLLVDGAGPHAPGNSREDTFFRAMLDSTAAGGFEIYDLNREGGFPTGAVVHPLFSLFRGVVWYGGSANESNDPAVYAALSQADRSGGLRHYLEDGGRVLLCAHNAVGDSAGLGAAFAQEVLGISEFFELDRSTNIGMLSGALLETDLTGGPDSLRMAGSVGTDFFLVDPDVTPLFQVRPGYFAATYPAQVEDIEPDQREIPAAVGVLSTRAGRIGLLTFLPSRANGFENRDAILRALLRQVLLE